MDRVGSVDTEQSSHLDRLTSLDQRGRIRVFHGVVSPSPVLSLQTG